MAGECPFCSVTEESLTWSSDVVVAIRDSFPVANGHTLVIPRRHVATYFDAGPLEQAEIWRAVGEIKSQLDAEFSPAGYNVGFNAGVAAGQTVPHLHVHVIPRYDGDTDDPRGGVRGVIPSKRMYEGMPSGPPTPASKSTANPFAGLPAFVGGDEDHLLPVIRKAIVRADTVDWVCAFAQQSGLDRVSGDLRDAAERGAAIRILVGDYMGVTSADALRQLLRLTTEHDNVRARLYLCRPEDAEHRDSFHPKAYVFSSGAHGVAFVGSSNLSRTALTSGVEWNLRSVSSGDDESFSTIRDRYDHVWGQPNARPLTRELIAKYEERAPVPAKPMPEPRDEAPQPHAVQREALAELRKARERGMRRGLAVMATGLGKTYLSAFDARALGYERALFVAHREEILDQALNTWQAVFPDRSLGRLTGKHKEPDVDVLFASVQTLSRKHHLRRFTPEHFDYIVIDEFHHASARTYRKLLEHFQPRYLLGLTATPDRMDGASLLELCEGNLVFQCNLVEGVARGLLVPFRYFGVKDQLDFEPIPWKSGRFDPAELTARVATRDRAAQALRELEARTDSTQRRVLAFCCSTVHADFMAEYFTAHGHPAAAVHSNALTSAPRADSLRRLRSGELEILCAVDVFNEGLDVPDITTVLMLRPTESPVIFLQQLGRGLRKSEGKSHLTVIDFIGNHRSFLQKPQALVYLSGEDLSGYLALRKVAEGRLDLPEGCSVEIEVEAVAMLERLARLRPDDALLYQYSLLRDTHGRRPTAAEVLSSGVDLKAASDRYRTWFAFVESQGDATSDEQRVSERHESWFRDLLTTTMNRSYKMLALQGLLDSDQLFGSISVHESAQRASQFAERHPLLLQEMRQDKDRQEFGSAFVAKWRGMPLKVWAAGKGTSAPWFELQGDEFRSLLPVVEEDRDAFEAMTAELVEYRIRWWLGRLRRKTPMDAGEAPIQLRVSHSNRRPILRFDRARRPDVPEGDVEVDVDGELYLLRFMKVAANVATAPEGGPNALPELMRRWFGPNAGQPGTLHFVYLHRTQGGWALAREAEFGSAEETVTPAPAIPYYVDVRAACGALDAAGRLTDAMERLQVSSERELDPARHFLVRASGNSMEGGARPIRDGDLVLCEWRRDASERDIVGHAMLLVGHDTPDGSFAVMKVPRRTENGWVLESWNPSEEPRPLPADATLEPVARVLDVVEESSGLVLWGHYDRRAVQEAFGGRPGQFAMPGHVDIVVGDKPHTVLFVTLNKPTDTRPEHLYKDRFVSAKEFQWESQASTKLESKKGRSITQHVEQGRQIHLFVRYNEKSDFIYCGAVGYRRHEGEKPMRVWFDLERPLPADLFKAWTR